MRPAALVEMNQQAEALQERMLQSALRTAALCRALPQTFDGRHVADQLFRSSTSAAANYRTARRGRSHREFAARLGVALEEADESDFWLTFVQRSGLAGGEQVAGLQREARELAAILTASVRTANGHQSRRPSGP